MLRNEWTLSPGVAPLKCLVAPPQTPGPCFARLVGQRQPVPQGYHRAYQRPSPSSIALTAIAGTPPSGAGNDGGAPDMIAPPDSTCLLSPTSTIPHTSYEVLRTLATSHKAKCANPEHSDGDATLERRKDGQGRGGTLPAFSAQREAKGAYHRRPHILGPFQVHRSGTKTTLPALPCPPDQSHAYITSTEHPF